MADATDNFNRADGSLGANWNTVSGSILISSNGAIGAGLVERVAETFGDDQYSEVLGATLLAGTGGPAVRIQDGSNHYYIFNNGDVVGLWKRTTADGFTNLDSAGGLTVTNTSVLRITVVGTNIKAFLNGVEVCDATDSDLASGNPGILSNGGCRYDSWLGGPLASTFQAAWARNANGVIVPA